MDQSLEDYNSLRAEIERLRQLLKNQIVENGKIFAELQQLKGKAPAPVGDLEERITNFVKDCFNEKTVSKRQMIEGISYIISEHQQNPAFITFRNHWPSSWSPDHNLIPFERLQEYLKKFDEEDRAAATDWKPVKFPEVSFHIGPEIIPEEEARDLIAEAKEITDKIVDTLSERFHYASKGYQHLYTCKTCSEWYFSPTAALSHKCKGGSK